MAGTSPAMTYTYVSTARGLGKQAEHVENQRLALEIVDLGVARRGVEALEGLGDAIEARRLGDAVEPRGKPVARRLDEYLEEIVVAVDAVAERVQRARVGRG